MTYNKFRHHGCNGCNQAGYGCQRMNTGNVNCNARPIRAIDAACIIPEANTGSIIPFSSGIVPSVLTSVAGGLVGLPSYVGFGTSVPGVVVLGNTINLAGLVSEAFTVPRAGSITAISASFSATLALALASTTLTITAQIYRAPAGSTTYTPTGASVNLSPLTGPIAIGQTVFGSTDLAPIPVAVGDKLLMVFSTTATGLTLINSVTGNASAGITIK